MLFKKGGLSWTAIVTIGVLLLLALILIFGLTDIIETTKNYVTRLNTGP